MAVSALLPDTCFQVWKFSSPLTASVFEYILPNASSSISSETKAKKLYKTRRKILVNNENVTLIISHSN